MSDEEKIGLSKSEILKLINTDGNSEDGFVVKINLSMENLKEFARSESGAKSLSIVIKDALKILVLKEETRLDALSKNKEK